MFQLSEHLMVSLSNHEAGHADLALGSSG